MAQTTSTNLSGEGPACGDPDRAQGATVAENSAVTRQSIALSLRTFRSAPKREPKTMDTRLAAARSIMLHPATYISAGSEKSPRRPRPDRREDLR